MLTDAPTNTNVRQRVTIKRCAFLFHACLCEAQYFFPSGNHGHPKAYNQYICACMHGKEKHSAWLSSSGWRCLLLFLFSKNKKRRLRRLVFLQKKRYEHVSFLGCCLVFLLGKNKRRRLVKIFDFKRRDKSYYLFFCMRSF